MTQVSSMKPVESCVERNSLPVALKVLIGGGFGAGKTTFVGAVSEIEPLFTEELITTASAGTDSLSGSPDKETTTVAFDFGRITLSAGPILFLFGTPGQDRFWFIWNELSAGALGGIVLADTRRLAACFPAVDFFELRRIPFVVAVNAFDDALRYGEHEVRSALGLGARVPIVTCDARDSRSATAALVALVEHLIAGPAPRQIQPVPDVSPNVGSH